MYIRLDPLGTNTHGHTVYQLEIQTDAVGCLRMFERLVATGDNPGNLAHALRSIRQGKDNDPRMQKENVSLPYGPRLGESSQKPISEAPTGRCAGGLGNNIVDGMMYCYEVNQDENGRNHDYCN